MTTFNDLPIVLQNEIFKIKEQLEFQDHKNQFASCERQLRRCINCNFGGCGWRADDVPYWFCGPECICDFKGIEYEGESESESEDESEEVYH